MLYKAQLTCPKTCCVLYKHLTIRSDLDFFEVLRSKSLPDLGALGLHTALLSLPRGTGQHCEAELLLEVAFVLCRKHLHFQAFMLTFQFGLFPTARSSCVTLPHICSKENIPLPSPYRGESTSLLCREEVD